LSEFPTLRTERLALIEITTDDVAEIFDIFSNDKVTRFYDCDSFKSKNEALKIIELFQKRFNDVIGIRWGITLTNAKKIIGTIGFNKFQYNMIGKLGYDLNENYWNRGIITEAIKIITEFGFKTLHIHRIEAEVIPENIASSIVLERNGYTKEGVMRDKGFWKNKHHTLILYSKLSTD
jgi:ribosomal-protein-alanine N-acetyltransferase